MGFIHGQPGGIHPVLRVSAVPIVLACLLATAACTSDSTNSSDRGVEPASSPVPPTGPPSGARCYAPTSPGTYHPVACDDPAAEAWMIKADRAASRNVSGLYSYDCNDDDADFALALDAQPVVETNAGTGPNFACLRTLNGPHLTEPGGGGGDIVVDDCVYAAEAGSPDPGTGLSRQSVAEVRCASAGVHQPAYRVLQVGGLTCPSATTFIFFITPLGSVDGQRACAGPI